MMDQQQFADYLFQGLGRPYLYLHSNDDVRSSIAAYERRRSGGGKEPLLIK
jgi:hypothetical protein